MPSQLTPHFLNLALIALSMLLYFFGRKFENHFPIVLGIQNLQVGLTMKCPAICIHARMQGWPIINVMKISCEIYTTDQCCTTFRFFKILRPMQASNCSRVANPLRRKAEGKGSGQPPMEDWFWPHHYF